MLFLKGGEVAVGFSKHLCDYKRELQILSPSFRFWTNCHLWVQMTAERITASESLSVRKKHMDYLLLTEEFS